MRQVLFLLVLCVACWTPASESAAAGPLNFVIIIADDMAWNDAGAYGHPHIRTPNIDRLAREGMRFDRAFLTTSSCSPSRSSILTGRYPHATGAGELHQHLPASQILVTKPLRDAGYYTAAAGKWHLGDAVRDRFDRIYGGRPSGCENWVQALADRPKNAPFFLWLAATDPHRPYRADTISEPHTPDDVVIPPFLPDNAETRADFAMYYDEVARMDSYIGAVLDELDRQDIADSTCVIFLSDNGRPFPRCKTTLYDTGIRTPFIVRYPGLTPRGASTMSLVSTVDLAPTVLELAKVKPLSTFQGMSFAAILADPARRVRERIFAEHNWHDFPARERAVRGDRYLYIRNEYADLAATPPSDIIRSETYRSMLKALEEGTLPEEHAASFIAPRAKEELYDTTNDPYTMHNVIDSPDLADLLGELRAELDAWTTATEDDAPPVRRRDEFDRVLGTRLPE